MVVTRGRQEALREWSRLDQPSLDGSISDPTRSRNNNIFGTRPASGACKGCRTSSSRFPATNCACWTLVCQHIDVGRQFRVRRMQLDEQYVVACTVWCGEFDIRMSWPSAAYLGVLVPDRVSFRKRMVSLSQLSRRVSSKRGRSGRALMETATSGVHRLPLSRFSMVSLFKCTLRIVYFVERGPMRSPRLCGTISASRLPTVAGTESAHSFLAKEHCTGVAMPLIGASQVPCK